MMIVMPAQASCQKAQPKGVFAAVLCRIISVGKKQKIHKPPLAGVQTGVHNPCQKKA